MSKKQILNWINLISVNKCATPDSIKKFIKITNHNGVIPICVNRNHNYYENTTREIIEYRMNYKNLSLQFKLDNHFNYPESDFAGHYHASVIIPHYIKISEFEGKRVFTMCIYNRAVEVFRLRNKKIPNYTDTAFSSVFIMTCPEIKDIRVWGNDKRPINSLSEIRKKFMFNCDIPINPIFN